MAGRNAREHAVDFGERHETLVHCAVEYSHREGARLTPHHVCQCVEQSGPRPLDRVDNWPPMPHNLATRPRTGSVEVRMYTRVGRTP